MLASQFTKSFDALLGLSFHVVTRRFDRLKGSVRLSCSFLCASAYSLSRECLGGLLFFVHLGCGGAAWIISILGVGDLVTQFCSTLCAPQVYLIEQWTRIPKAKVLSQFVPHGCWAFSSAPLGLRLLTQTQNGSGPVTGRNGSRWRFGGPT